MAEPVWGRATCRAQLSLALAWLMTIVATATPADAQTLNDAALNVTVFASDLEQPTGLRFIGPNDALVIEKATGRVRRVKDGIATTVLDLPVNSFSERGLLGIEVDPDFTNGSSAYVYYSRSTTAGDTTMDAQWTDNRLVKYTWDGTNLTGEQPLLTFAKSATQNNGPNHDAGPVIFGPDGKLYGTTGDLNRSGAEQNTPGQAGNSAGVGGIYRINPDGSIPTDNPFHTSSNAAFHKWYAYGVRNTFGIAFDPVTGVLWDTENGPTNYDEVNRVAPGFNSGWTQIMGPAGRVTGSPSLVSLPGSAYSDPEFSWLQTVAPTALRFLADTALDQNYRDALIVGDSNTGRLYLFRLNAARDGFILADSGLQDLVADNATEANSVAFGSGFGATTDIQVGPDGALYLTSLTTGNIYRVAVNTPWRNSANPLDADQDDEIGPLDALAIINDLNDNGGRALANPPIEPNGPPPYLDVNGDNMVTPIDALLIINFLNENGATGNQNAFSAAAVPEPGGQVLWLLALLCLAVGVAHHRASVSHSSR